MQTKDVNVRNEILLLEVTGLTRSSWMYLKTMELQLDNEGNPLVDPSKVYTQCGKGLRHLWRCECRAFDGGGQIRIKFRKFD